MAIAANRWRALNAPALTPALTKTPTATPDPVGPIVAAPVEVCATAEAANARLKWWMGLAVVAAGVAVGVLISRR